MRNSPGGLAHLGRDVQTTMIVLVLVLIFALIPLAAGLGSELAGVERSSEDRQMDSPVKRTDGKRERRRSGMWCTPIPASRRMLLARSRAGGAYRNLKEFFGEILVPTEEVVEMRGGQKRRSERKFFPGYVLVQMELNDDTWHLVKETPRVMGFIGGKADQPAPLTEAEANAILDRVAAGSEKATRRKRYFEPGEIVRVVDGPFNDFTGVVKK